MNHDHEYVITSDTDSVGNNYQTVRCTTCRKDIAKVFSRSIDLSAANEVVRIHESVVGLAKGVHLTV